MIIKDGVEQTRPELATHDSAIKADIGDFSAQSNLTTLLAALGIPDTSGKPLYTCLITDRLDDATNGLANLKSLIDTADTAIDNVQTDLGNFSGRTYDGTLLDVIGLPDVENKDLYTCLVTDRLDNATYGLSALQTDIAAIPTTAQRGTDDAFLASVGGALDTAAATGAVDNATLAMGYLKQLVTDLLTAAADVANIDGDAMRGTDSAALASVLGALADVAAEGAVTEADTVMQYAKQLVTLLLNGTYGLSALDTDIGTANTSLGHGTYGLSALQVLIAALQTDLDNGTDGLGALKALIDAAQSDITSILGDTGTDGVVLGTKVAAYKRLVGENQIATTTEDLNQAAASYDLFTGTTQPVALTAFSIKMPDDLCSDATLTSISVQTDDTTAGVIISAADGAVANLTAEAELSWTGWMRINAGTKIQLTIAGGAEGAEYITTCTAKCEAIADGGYLA